MRWRATIGSLAVTAALATLLVAAGCNKSDGVGDQDAGANQNNNHVLQPDGSQPGPDGSQPGVDAGPQSCTQNSYTKVDDLATANAAGSAWTSLFYQAYDSAEYPVNRISLQVYDDFGGPRTPGTYTLQGGADSNYETCGLCPLIYVYDTAGNPLRTFYADTGTVEITAIGGIGDTFAATFHNLVFREVTIAENFHSTLVPGGQTWCFDGYSFNLPIDDSATSCPYPGTCLTDNIVDFPVVECENGTTVNLLAHTTSATNALWIVGSHEW